jgi:hypothetical protein
VGVASPTEVGEWVEAVAHNALSKRAEKIAEIESSSSSNINATMEADVQRSVDLPVSQASQLSSISVSKNREPVSRPKRTWLYVVAGLATLSGMLLVVALASHHTAPSDSAASSLGSPPAMTREAPPPATTEAAPEPSMTAPTATPPTATAPPPAATVAAPATTGGRTVPRVHHVSTATGGTAAPPPKNCDPPYTLDAKGHKLWKPECM